MSCSSRNSRRSNMIGFSLSIRLRLIEDFLGNEAQNQLLSNRCDPSDSHFAKQSLDVILLGIAEAAKCHHRLQAGVEARARAEKLARIGLGSTGLAVVVKPRGLGDHELCGFELHPSFGQRMLYPLVHADRASEDYP